MCIHFFALCQIHLHRNLHFWVTHKNCGSRFLYRWLHLPQRPMELAGFHGHLYGVSIIQTLMKHLDNALKILFCMQWLQVHNTLVCRIDFKAVAELRLVAFKEYMVILISKIIRKLKIKKNNSFSVPSFYSLQLFKMGPAIFGTFSLASMSKM